MVAGRVAVVGAGLAGLSAALDLKKAGCEVDLFERSRLLGGKATSFHIDGTEVDNGQHVFLACCDQFIAFVKEVEEGSGAPAAFADGPLLHMQDRFQALLLRRGKRPTRLRAMNLPAPLHLASALLGYQALAVFDRVRLARALLSARRSASPGETFSRWLDRHRQTPATRSTFWEPFLVPALNAGFEEVSAEDALFVIRMAFLQDAGAARFGYSRVPLARIAESAASRLDRVHLRTPVTGIQATSGTDSRVRGIVVEGGETAEFDGVVLAVPPNRLIGILDSPQDLGIAGLDRFHFAPIIDVHLWFDLPSVGFDFAAVLDSPVQWVFEKGPGYLCCSMSAADDFISMSNQDLVELCRVEVQAVLPQLAAAKLIRGAATRDREATFVPEVGLARPGVKTRVTGLVVAGAWTDTGWPATMESAVRSGREAAKWLVESMIPAEVAVG